MTQILIYFFLAIGLSMDAFSIALAYGTKKIKLNKILYISTLIGIFHFIMPIIGSFVGLKVESIIPNINSVVGLVFLTLAIQMFLNRNETSEVKKTDNLSLIALAFSVSIDSFTIGIGIGMLKNRILLPATIFSLTSSIISFTGLIIGSIIGKKFGNKASYIGIIILLLIALKYIF